MPAGSAAPNLYAAGRAATLFAACGPELAGRKLVVEGRKIAGVAFGRIATLLSYVDPAQYAPTELERRSSDAAWLAREARIHELAVERASVHGAVLPLAPFTIVAAANAVDAYVREHAARWMRALGRLGQKRECAVHVYVGPHALPPAEPYLLRIAARAQRSGRTPALNVPPDIAQHAVRLWGTCSALAQGVRGVRIPARRGALWSAALLVAPGDVNPLREAIERSASAGASLGLSVYLEGPRAPFSFAA